MSPAKIESEKVDPVQKSVQGLGHYNRMRMHSSLGWKSPSEYEHELEMSKMLAAS